MPKSRFSEDDMVKILREADKTPVAEVAKMHVLRTCRRRRRAALGPLPTPAPPIKTQCAGSLP